MSLLDVNLFNVPTHGEVGIENGDLQRSRLNVLTSLVYISLFGSNKKDDGVSTEREQYWANGFESEEPYKLRSETSTLIRKGFGTREKALALQGAIERDLAWLITTGKVKAIDSIDIDIGTGKVSITIEKQVITVT